jgi:methylenetetrahydrofolate dehydrogenase (NADP+)/methenyltetrahydrofolate cyclohydrolase
MLATKLIDGKARADRLLADVAAAAASLRGGPGIVPGLCAVLVGRDPASEVYVRGKGKAATAAGIASFQHVLPETTSEAELLALIATLNADDQVDGILVQLPLPKHIDPQRVIDAIDPAKDVDGFHAQNVGHLWSGGRALVPCTPYGCLMLLRDALPSSAGAEAIVLGRSNIVGKPMAALLLSENCTVTLVHSAAATSPRSCAGPTFWWRRWDGRNSCAATGSSPASSSSTSASTGSRSPAASRSSSATWLLPGRRASPPRSPRFRAASAR